MPAHEIIRLAETSSTNLHAVQLLSGVRPPEGTVVITDHQLNGMGQGDNRWESEPGKNLTFSLILYPVFSADRQFILNKALTLGIHAYLQSELPESAVSVKWPNDIYIGGRKACGILIRNSVIGTRFDYAVAGIGLNVNQTHFVSNAPNPVSMKMVSGKEYDLNRELEKLLVSLSAWYKVAAEGRETRIEKAYQQVLYRRMEWHEYELKNRTITARITGTSPYGQLLLEENSGETHCCDLKEVRFLP
jgi:BirA family transcriptional regulator, biotin operon repressor / biotin---[acetyl-CoA-carboxylase] ligase